MQNCSDCSGGARAFLKTAHTVSGDGLKGRKNYYYYYYYYYY